MRNLMLYRVRLRMAFINNYYGIIFEIDEVRKRIVSHISSSSLHIHQKTEILCCDITRLNDKIILVVNEYYRENHIIILTRNEI